MLNIPTIQVVTWANFVSLVVVWTYVIRSYPTLKAARFWQLGALLAAVASSIALLRGVVPAFIPVIFGNGLMITGICLAWWGVRQFYGRPIPLRASVIVTLSTMVALAIGLFVYDSIALRVVLFSIGENTALFALMRDLHQRPAPRRSPGADLALLMCGTIFSVNVIRSIAAVAGISGPISLVDFNPLQSFAFVFLVFGGIMAHFGFVLMAVDRLRAEVAALALADELTGIANRRQFLVRLSEACALATRTRAPFSLLVIDIDDFKTINDTYGHGAGDECLRVFARTVAGRLRSTDLLARSGGDEFCAILPSTRLTEAALLARNLIKACRKAEIDWNGQRIPITTSIGIAEWSPQIGGDMDRLISEADQALYVAKKQGRDRLAVHEYVVERLRQTA
jgi:diguanylate cyclase (GGDEF)-like protein